MRGDAISHTKSLAQHVDGVTEQLNRRQDDKDPRNVQRTEVVPSCKHDAVDADSDQPRQGGGYVGECTDDQDHVT